MTKYIIKNCPSCRDYDVFGRDNEGCCYLKMEYCKDVADCTMKQIVEKCKEAVKTFYNNEFFEDEFDIFMGEKNMAEEILSMLKIQECE